MKKQHDYVIEAMIRNGGFATLGFLYRNVDISKWGTKTPFHSIRRIVQDRKEFFRIKPGLWSLEDYREKLPFDVNPNQIKNKKEEELYNHSYYQGLLVEIGNMNKFGTFVPYQDKNKNYLGQKLGDITTIEKFYEFGYKNFIRNSITIDVSWFNNRKMPNSFFEVEYSTDIKNSLSKFVELQDFNIGFCIVADNVRKKEYEDKLSLLAFKDIKGKVKFLSYDSLIKNYNDISEIIAMGENSLLSTK